MTTLIDDVFDSNWLKASDLKGREHVLTIATAEAKKMRDGKGKVALSFVGREKQLLANVTNSRFIAEKFGRDIDAWVGKEVTLYPTKVEFSGNLVDAIRVKVTAPRANPADPAALAQEGRQRLNGPPAGHPASEAPFDDDIPF